MVSIRNEENSASSARWDTSVWERPLTPSGRLRSGQRPDKRQSASKKECADTFFTDISLWHVGSTADNNPGAASLVLAEEVTEPFESTDMIRTARTQNTFTIQYMGMAKGELGVLSKREMIPVKAPTPPTVIASRSRPSTAPTNSSMNKHPYKSIARGSNSKLADQADEASKKQVEGAADQADEASKKQVEGAADQADEASKKQVEGAADQADEASKKQVEGAADIVGFADDVTGRMRVPTNLFSSQGLKALGKHRHKEGTTGQTGRPNEKSSQGAQNPVMARLQTQQQCYAQSMSQGGGMRTPPTDTAPCYFHNGLPYPSRPRPVSAPLSFPAWRITAGGFSGWKLSRYAPSRIRQPEPSLLTAGSAFDQAHPAIKTAQVPIVSDSRPTSPDAPKRSRSPPLRTDQHRSRSPSIASQTASAKHTLFQISSNDSNRELSVSLDPTQSFPATAMETVPETQSMVSVVNTTSGSQGGSQVEANQAGGWKPSESLPGRGVDDPPEQLNMPISIEQTTHLSSATSNPVIMGQRHDSSIPISSDLSKEQVVGAVQLPLEMPSMSSTVSYGSRLKAFDSSILAHQHQHQLSSPTGPTRFKTRSLVSHSDQDQRAHHDVQQPSNRLLGVMNSNTLLRGSVVKLSIRP
ncbi:hypothetical protein CEUSTIGMA_g12884.t1 [Chlamydomonas eustigma]|uniref:Uncharacterized protein n=1 Tax=Chlamydomonas eustigma TaxID=1157962 RepID=A0A250XQX8_9CHLO|nr:hypothetical protein CEUSTIGMA_g12884.t1 [Chlamydomonas eustigma]|eukprot:GAX85468.1 hypothetical protein CEUSTIGMA_g12884.t1 [Chlamydomonas eustigma]